MKKRMKYLLMLIAFVLLMTGCNKSGKADETTAANTEDELKTVKDLGDSSFRKYLDGLKSDEVDESGELITAASIANRVLGCVNAPSLIQKVIQYCIRHKVTVNVEAYEKNRDLLYHALKEDGFTCAKPDGAFYLFVKSPVADEKEFCETAKKHHVLMVPGSSFACPGYVRIAYCVSHEQIERSLPAFREIAREYGLLK